MSVLEVVSAGIVTSIQDGGRFGAQRYGLPPSGAMDRLALATANVLVGNATLDAAIEIGPQGAVFAVKSGTVRIAVSGTARAVDVDGHGKRLHHTILLAEGERLTLGVARDGIFGYLAVAGGIAGEPTFGSLSVNARAGLGSPFPRPLHNNDRLKVGTAAPDHERMIQLPSNSDGPIRVVMGPQDDEFGEACPGFLNSEWRISSSSDRMGYRLDGPKLAHAHGHNIVSDGTVDGSIQVSGNGQPIVLMKDRGTTGGYPKIATVITADLGRFAQTRFGRPFRFKAISIEDAQNEARTFRELIDALPGMIHDVTGTKESAE